METFIEAGRLPISNNLCEANIKLFTTASRTWLFVDTPKGAKANAILYTLMESARENDLDVYAYLKYLLTEMLNNHHLENPKIIDCYLPWAMELPDEYRLKRQNKKCFKDDIDSVAERLLNCTTSSFRALTFHDFVECFFLQ